MKRYLITIILAAAGSVTAGDWTPLFDGKSLEGWRGYRGREIEGTGWTVSDGMLHCDKTEPRIDLLTEKQFENYELDVEWKTVPDGNGGLFIHADESTEKLPYNAPEIQFQANGERELPIDHAAGTLYGLYPAKPEAIKPAGEWNLTRIVADGAKLEIWHNGVLICQTTIGGKEWKEKIAAGKFAGSPTFGVRTKGYIGLQDYGREIWFRKIRIRDIGKPE